MKRLLILSGKGGTGKTTTAAALIALSRAKALADCDVDAPNLHLVTAMEGKPETSTFLGGQKAVIDPDRCLGCGTCEDHCRFAAVEQREGLYRIRDYACEGCGVCAYLCPAGAITLQDDVAGEKKLWTKDRVFSTATLKMGRGNSGKLVSQVKLAMFKAAPEAELSIVDGSPGIGCPVIASVSGMDLVLVVAEPSCSGVSDLKRLRKTAETFQAKLAVCVNKWDVSPEHTAEIETFCREEQIPFVGKIPYDPSASAAINAGKSIVSLDCPAAKALKELYETLITL